MKKSFLLLLLIASAIKLFSQNPYQIGNAVWPVSTGHNISFCNGPTVGTGNIFITTFEGYAAISDMNCNLVLYSDGRNVYNAAGGVMSNSTALSPGGELDGDPSASQGVVIVPKPGDPLTYYIFCADANLGANGYTYSRIDMSLNSGLGDIDLSEKNITVLAPFTTEKITATMHVNGTDIWVMTHKFNSNEFVAFLITNAGVQLTSPITSAVGLSHVGSSANTRGYMKFSQTGTQLALALEGDYTVQLFNFNKTTGIVSNPITLTNITMNSCYGLEFSPNEQFLYCSERWGTNIYQWDISSGVESIIAATMTNISTTTVSVQGALQLAPDGKIYCARNGQTHLSVINNPDMPGVSCGYVESVLDIAPDSYSEGLPNHAGVFVNSGLTFTITDETCPGATNGEIAANIALLPYDSLVWSNGSVGLLLSNLAAGSYIVSVYDGGLVSLIDTALVGMGAGVTVNVTVDHPTPITPNSGSIQLQPVSGLAPFIYVWSTGSSASTITGLAQGTYWYTVTDVTGCVASDSVVLVNQNTVPWSYNLTSGNHTILLPQASQIDIAGNCIVPGDYIGAFYDSLGTLKCGGYAEWTGGTLALSAWGADVGYDGFAAGEAFQWKFWRQATFTEYIAYASYNQLFPDLGNYNTNGMSMVDTLQTLSISGNISTPSKAPLDMGFLLAYQKNGNQYRAIAMDSINNGSYKITGIEPGEYVLHAIPDPVLKEALPGYYPDGDDWQGALVLNADSIVKNLNYVIPNFQTYNTGTVLGAIYGVVYQGSDETYNASIFDTLWFDIPTKDVGDPARNITVLLYDENQNPLDFDLTDETGGFRFEFLDYGTYYFRVEKAGSLSTLIEVILSAGNPVADNFVFTLNDGNITGINRISSSSSIHVYPNPVKETLTIEATELKSLRLFDFMGQSLNIDPEAKFGHSNTTRLNLIHLSAGVYLLELSTGKQLFRKKIIKN